MYTRNFDKSEMNQELCLICSEMNHHVVSDLAIHVDVHSIL